MSGFYKNIRMIAGLTLLAVSSLLYAGFEEGENNAIYALNSGTKLGVGGLVSMECGQYINSYYVDRIQPNRPWILRSKGRLDFRATVGERLHINLSPEIMLWFDTYTWQDMGNEAFKYPFSQHYDVNIAEAQGILDFSFFDVGTLEFAAGIFPYKYNDNARNLGEYLFRTGARPAFIRNSFDFTYAKLTGLRLGTSLFDDRLTTDIMLTAETEVIPSRDWALSLVSNYTTDLISFGAGIMLDHLFPVDHSLTKPTSVNSRYYTQDNKEEYLTFGGTKVASHLSFDPKTLFPEDLQERFGKNDAVIYAEIALLGLKSFENYKHYMNPQTGITDTNVVVLDSSRNYYADLGERIPIMFGVTLPTFKFMDYLSLEFEYFGSPYPNSTGNVVGFRDLVAEPNPDDVNPKKTYEMDNWKYSLNFKKTVVKGFSVIGQLARDHTRHDYFYKGYLDLSEILVETDNIEGFGDLFNPTEKWGAFGWWLKVQYTF